MSLAGSQLRRVDTIEDAAEFLRWIEDPRPILAIDTETTGRDWWKSNFTRLVQFGDSQTGWTLGVHYWWAIIQEALERIRRSDIPVVAHNAKFDMHALRVAGFSFPRRHQWHDTMLMHTLLYPLELHGLKDVSTKLVAGNAAEASNQLDKTMKQNGWTWETIPYHVPIYSIYAGLDTILCARLFDLLAPQIQRRFPEPYEVEMQTANIMYCTEFRGMRVDLDYCEKLLDKYQHEMEVIAGKLGSFGITNPSSNDQIITYLMEEEDWEPTFFTDKGNIKFDKKIKESLDYEIVELCADYGRRLKWSSYVDKILSMNDNGIVYPSIKTIEARTGRMSIGSDKKEKGTGRPVAIPFQQLPHVYEARRPILPRYEGYVLRPIDYDSQELRVLASMSGAAGLIKAIADGQDMHIYTASAVFGIPYDEISKDDPIRNIAKMSRYLQVYGGGAEKLSNAVNIPLQQAIEFKEKDNAMFPEIKQFMSRVINTGKDRYRREGRGYIESWGGREIEVDNPKYVDGELQEYFYKLANYIIQGSCADLLKRKIIALESAGLMDYVDLPVHDELVISVPDDEEGNEIAHEIKDTMEELTAFAVPLTCELSKPYPNWGSKYLRPGEFGWDEQPAEELI